ncbi:hypothetical protein CHS0354_025041 [Potamilus streckersoni]|uniref:Adenosine deaminase domain-containing protein n=1 Tax=Potamilus streckersoni TaxID=2493646 RepID=A0AAE0T932_9BIVA|nr:hypothetical protein CHS0354_025041 [Potamilus streckersoni]
MSLDFCKRTPKVELHAHLNGSISRETIEKLAMKKNPELYKDLRICFDKGKAETLDNVFQMFKLIHQISDNTEAIYTIAYDVIHEFSADNVKYLELRSTPRDVPSSGMTKSSYIEAILKAIEDCHKENLDIVVKFLLAIDRRNDLSVAKETVDLAERYSRLSGGTVVGIDLSGDPTVGDACTLVPILRDAKFRGLKLALHLAEVPAVEETEEVLKILPDRIGHGTCLHPNAGGSQGLVDTVLQHRIPLELCLTSNVICQTVAHVDNHHFKYWYDQGHPCAICTDDKGVFSTSLSEEYCLAAETFGLTRKDIWTLSYNCIDMIFAEEAVKQDLKSKWNSVKSYELNCE